MTINKINRITVVGSGAMGSQISMVCALAGYQVVLHDVQQGSLDNARNILEEQMSKRVAKGRLSQEEVNEAFNRLTFSPCLADSVKETDFVIEAIVEKIESKQILFQEMDQLAPSHAIFATNSSTIVSSKLAHVTQRPEKVCNMHFFNPALVMELVEVVKGPHTSESTASIAVELAKSIKKTPILMEKEIFGFVANRILTAIFDEAMYLYENGFASFEEIDLACTKGLNHPIGPFSLLDLTGIDVNYHIKSLLYDETKDEKDAPSRSLQELYEKGDLGRKTGKGFYAYN
jgi:3-hydroxybutyryl-CoA dehydrogenase